MVGKILIVDSTATNRIVLRVALEDAFYHPVLATDGESCLHLARDTAPDLIMLDLALPDQPGVSVIRQLRADPATREIPVLAFAAHNEGDLRLMAFQAGADDVLEKPVNLQPLLARVRNLLRGRDGLDDLPPGIAGPALKGFAEAATAFHGPAIVCLIAAQDQAARERCDTLSRIVADRIVIRSREEAFMETEDTVGQKTPDVFLIDGSSDGYGGGLRLLSELRSRPTTRHAAVCIIYPSGAAGAAAIAFDMGADDVVNADIPPQEMALRLQALIRRKRREDRLRTTVQDGLRLSVLDPLTGLHNRRYAMPQLVAIAERAASEGSVFAVMVIDLDRFKSVNDRLGHAAGDAVLVEVAKRLQCSLRSDDLLARIGGEEFLVALPNTSFEDACIAADRLRHAVEERPVQASFASNLRVTVSIGLAISAAECGLEPVPKIVDRADRALLKAKADGRNKVTISKTAA